MEKKTAVLIVQILAILGAISGVLAILGGIMLAGGSTMMMQFIPQSDMPAGAQGALGAIFIAAAAITIIMGAVSLFVAYGLWKFKRWAQIVSIVFAVLGLLGFPIGTIINAIVIYLLAFNPEIKKLFK